MESHRYTRDQLSSVPKEPGVYKFFDKEGTILYVGKAKALRNRVGSYFNAQKNTNRKTIRLVSEIEHIEVVILNSEFDALLLENSLIKENQPKYNILLKDDKSFPSILVTNERFPKIYSTRRIDRSLGEYFGPYTSVKAMNSVLDLLRKLYKIRTCNFNLSKSNIRRKKFKVCLEYHLGNCLGPCEGLQTEQHYMQELEQAKLILKGKVAIVKSQYLSQMQEAARELNFELAEELKQKLELLEKFQSKSLIVHPKITDIDVISLISGESSHFINYMRIDDGSIRVSETVEVKTKMDEGVPEVLSYVLPNLQLKFQSTNTEILCNHEIPLWEGLNVTVPQIGDKRKLLDLSIRNALSFKQDKEKQKKETVPQGAKTLEQLRKDLRLKDPPVHIECFDNSNIQGSNPVASMVCFRDGKPSKKDYRKFNIKTVEGPDDFNSMKEIVHRRYSHLLRENIPLPNLVLIDGGKGQLNAATSALKDLNLYGKIALIGIAKRLEEIYYPEDPVPLHISKKSASLKLLQRLRDEAHRFAITFHRDKRSKASLQSALDSIPGIGEQTKNRLLSKFKSISGIKQADENELKALIGTAKAAIISDHLK